MNTASTELLDKLARDRLEAVTQREKDQNYNRNILRDYATQLREPGDPFAGGPGSTTNPTFKIGDVTDYPHVSDRAPTGPDRGHLSEPAFKDFMGHMREASSRPDANSRDAATSKAASVVAKDFAHQKQLSPTAQVLHDARAQVTFAGRELGQKLGLGAVESQALGYSLERALEKEGFKVMASHAIDKVGDVFKPSSASVATATGMRAAMESNLNKSMEWMGQHGVTREALKDALSKHSGKFAVIMEVARHPEAMQRVGQILSHSDKALDGVMALGKDAELRKAVGTMTMSVGESVAIVNKGVGSVAVLAGAALRGDSAAETGRHAFRAAMSILGGAAGGIAAGSVSAGFGSVAGAIGGAAAGSALADKVLEAYDKHFSRETNREGAQQLTTAAERQESKNVIVDRIAARANEGVDTAKSQAKDMGREMSFERGKS